MIGLYLVLLAGWWSNPVSPLVKRRMNTSNSRIGLVLFLFYCLLYVGFVLLNAFAPATMERTPIAGVNLAILYGFGLIIAAFVLAVIYGLACRSTEDES